MELSKTLELPEGYKRCSELQQLCKLKRRKRKYKPDNMELEVGKTIYLRSHYSNIYYKKKILEDMHMEKIQRYINLGLLYYKP